MRFPRPPPPVMPAPRPLIRCLYEVYVAPRFTLAMIRALLRERGAAPLGGGGDSGGESLSGLARFPRPAASARALFSSFCDSASSQHASSSIGAIASVIFSNSLRTRAVTPSQMGGILFSSTRPRVGSFAPSFPSSSSDDEEYSSSEYSLDSSPSLPAPSGRSTRTRFLDKSGGCTRLRFSHSKSMRTATRNDVRP